MALYVSPEHLADNMEDEMPVRRKKTVLSDESCYLLQ